jgi:hypothetical protein
MRGGPVSVTGRFRTPPIHIEAWAPTAEPCVAVRAMVCSFADLPMAAEHHLDTERPRMLPSRSMGAASG